MKMQENVQWDFFFSFIYRTVNSPEMKESGGRIKKKII